MTDKNVSPEAANSEADEPVGTTAAEATATGDAPVETVAAPDALVEPTATVDERAATDGDVDTGTDVGAGTDVNMGTDADVAVIEEPVAPGAAAVHAPVQTVYLTAPNPPRKKGNRGIGTLYALLATLAFALVFAGIAAILILFVKPEGVAGALGEFVSGPLFYVPVAVFLVIMILWVLLANRASWWAWVIGSLVIATVVYFASIGILILLAGGFGLTAAAATALFYSLASNPIVIAAALIAREASIWFGAAISVRGRKVRERNYAAWEAFEREEAEKRAQFGGQPAA